MTINRQWNTGQVKKAESMDIPLTAEEFLAMLQTPKLSTYILKDKTFRIITGSKSEIEKILATLNSKLPQKNTLKIEKDPLQRESICSENSLLLRRDPMKILLYTKTKIRKIVPPSGGVTFPVIIVDQK